MRSRVAYPEGRPTGRLITAGLVALLSSACSSDAFRFSDNPFANPFAAARLDASPTGTIPTAPPPALPIVSKPLPPPSTPSLGATPARLPSAAVPRTLGATTGAAKGWTASGGVPIVAGQGDNVDGLANRYGVPAAAIREVNGLPPGGAIAPGTRLTIPAFKPSAGKRAEAPEPKLEKPVPPKPVEAKAPSKKPELKKEAVVKKEEPKKLETKVVKVETKPVKPEVKKTEPKTVKVEAPPPEKKLVAKVAPPPSAAPPPVVRKENVEPADTTGTLKPGARKPAPKAEEPPTTVVAKAEPEFRWPTKGRIIRGFGTSGNDGINIAVPEGTPVHAAEEGVVAYAGDELKGYGKLLLIRHGNGWVSAYAHNGELMVRKGDKVRRGQPVAKAGQTGDVASPQVHFELRKGATPMDPSGLLPK